MHRSYSFFLSRDHSLLRGLGCYSLLIAKPPWISSHRSVVHQQQTGFDKFLKKITNSSILQTFQADVKLSNAMSLIQTDMRDINQSIKDHIVHKIAVLNDISEYYFNLEGKKLRPALVLLTAQAMEDHLDRTTKTNSNRRVSQKHLLLAEATEIIHTASLVHDDVIDLATTRRGRPSVNQLYENKLVILAGDYLLARASGILSKIRNFQVTELMTQSLEDLVEGEFIQLGDQTDFDLYLQKCYYKAASLMSNSCASAAVLSDGSEQEIRIFSNYGKYVGLAFQITDDLLDITQTSNQLGKEAAVDLGLGLATAPVFFAMRSYPELRELAKRKFSQPGDIERTLQLIESSSAIEQTTQLVTKYCDLAIEAISSLNPSPALEALADVPLVVKSRNK